MFNEVACAASAVRDGDNAMITGSYHVKKLEVAEMKMCRWACGQIQRGHLRNDNIRERLKVENITEMCRKALTREETRQRIRRKTDTGDGTTWDKKKSKTEAGMDGLC